MEADTKNKKGRPVIFKDPLYAIYFDKEKRTAQNLYYAGDAIQMMAQKPGDFFITSKGNLRRQGIAEQIGRLHRQDGFPEDYCKDICYQAISLVNDGESVKTVEQKIRNLRIEKKKGR